MEKYKYALAIVPEEPRCLVSISYNMISFNLANFMKFDTPAEAEEYKSQWKGHFFNLDQLSVVKVKEK